MEPFKLPLSNCKKGITKWEDESYDPSVSKAMRISPNEHMEGFFVARLRKISSSIPGTA